MILISNYDELCRHLENLRDMADAKAFAERKTPRGSIFPAGQSHGLTEALKAIDAWEALEESQRSKENNQD